MTKSLYFKGLTLLLVAVLLFGGLIFVNRILRGDAFSKEEAQHALYSVWLVKDIQALNVGAFLYDTQRQMNWPFLHSWLLSAFFLVFGVSYTAARALSLLFFLLSIVAQALQASQVIAEERGCLTTYGDEYREYLNRTPRWIGMPKSS